MWLFRVGPFRVGHVSIQQTHPKWGISCYPEYPTYSEYRHYPSRARLGRLQIKSYFGWTLFKKSSRVMLISSNIKWGYIEQRGDIEQSYFFHGNSLISFYNRHVASCLCFISVTEGFCSPLQKFSKCPHNLWLSFFCLNNNFQTKKFDYMMLFWDEAFIKS